MWGIWGGKREGVVYRCRQRRGDSEAPTEHRAIKNRRDDRPSLGIMRDMKGRMSHIANYCQSKRMVEFCDFLAYRLGRSNKSLRAFFLWIPPHVTKAGGHISAFANTIIWIGRT